MLDSPKNFVATVVIPAKDEDEQLLTELKYHLSTYPYASLEVLVVDDGSKIPLKCADIRHDVSKGYGAALKSGIQKAKGTLIITMDGDGQHRYLDVFRLLDTFLYFTPQFEMLIGKRQLHESSWKRYWGRKGLNMLASLFTSQWIADLNSGMRIFRRQTALNYEPILCNGFSYTTSLTMSILTDGNAIEWIPIKVDSRLLGQSHVNLWRDGWVTFKYIFVIGLALRTRRLRGWLRPLWRWTR